MVAGRTTGTGATSSLPLVAIGEENPGDGVGLEGRFKTR
jgi:hypothetical protein